MKIRIGNTALVLGDCVEVMRTLPEACVDAVVTDPPYNIGFMGKSWDATGIAFDPATWREVLRVLKPGGHLLAFGGARMYHRMTCAIEDAGFEIRDCLSWVYGSGFSKVGMISKRIDKAARGFPQGSHRTDSPNAGRFKTQATEGKRGKGDRGQQFGAGPGQFMRGTLRGAVESGEVRRSSYQAAVTDAKQWAGWAGSLRPAHEPIVVARKPFAGTVVANVLKHGTGVLNIDGCRTAHMNEADRAAATPQGRVTSKDSGSIGAEPDVGQSAERLDFVRPDTSKGRWPTNLLLTCTCDPPPALVDDPPVPRCDEATQDARYADVGGTNFAAKPGARRKTVRGPIHTDPECPCVVLDAQAGFRQRGKAAPGGHKRNLMESPVYDAGRGLWVDAQTNDTGELYGDAGGVSRYFPVFYASKASGNERWAYCQDCSAAFAKPVIVRDHGHDHVDEHGRQIWAHVTYHQTVKPVALMRWLIRLVTPPGGVVLDPFAGTGTTGVAAIMEGFRCVLVEQDETYYRIAEARLTSTVVVV